MSLKADLENITEEKNNATNFTAQLMRIVFKADVINKAKLHTVFPNLVRTVQAFMDTGEKLDLPYDEAVAERVGGQLSCGCLIRPGEPVLPGTVKIHYRHTIETILIWELMHRKGEPQSDEHIKLCEARINLLNSIGTLFPEVKEIWEKR